MALLEAAGYACTRAAASLGIFDIVGIGSQSIEQSEERKKQAIATLLADTSTTALTATQTSSPPSGNRVNPAIPPVASATSMM